MPRKIAVPVVALLVLVLCAIAGNTASAGKSVQSYWPPIIDEPFFSAWFVGPNQVELGTNLNYPGGLSPRYPELRSPTGHKGFQVTLYLPKGVHILKSKFRVAPPYAHLPATELHWTLNKAGQPTWTYHRIDSSVFPTWLVVVSVPKQLKHFSFGAVLKPFGVRNAPTQKANSLVTRPGAQ